MSDHKLNEYSQWQIGHFMAFACAVLGVLGSKQGKMVKRAILKVWDRVNITYHFHPKTRSQSIKFDGSEFIEPARIVLSLFEFGLKLDPSLPNLTFSGERRFWGFRATRAQCWKYSFVQWRPMPEMTLYRVQWYVSPERLSCLKVADMQRWPTN